MPIEYKYIRMKNFKSYEDSTIEFAPSPNITIVQGNNGTGKTSILDAIKWVWYGNVITRTDSIANNMQLINHEAMNEQPVGATAEVQLEFTLDGSTYNVIRSYKSGAVTPTITLTIDGEVQGLNPDLQLDRILPEQISKFFLFDGEDLSKYEEQLETGGTRFAQQIKAQIETIMGIPAIQKAQEHISALKKSAQRQVNKYHEQNSQMLLFTSQSEQIESDIDSKQLQITDFKQQLVTINEQIDEHLAKAQQNDQMKAKIDRKKDLNRLVQKSEEDISSLQSEIIDVSTDLWKDIAQPVIQRIRNEIEPELNNVREQRMNLTQEHAYQRLLEEHLHELSNCQICNSPINNTAKTHIEGQIHSNASDDLNILDEKIVSLTNRLNGLREVNPQGLQKIITDKETQQSNKRREINASNQEIEELNKYIDGHVEELIETSTRNYAALIGNQQKLTETIENLESEIIALNDNLLLLQDQIEKQPITNPEGQKYQDLVHCYNGLDAMYGNAVDKVIYQLKQSLQNFAEKAFLEINGNDQYKGLRINDNYGFDTIYPNGEVVTLRNAAQEQWVALALIGGLCQLSQIKSPMVLDTGFGRMDNDRTLRTIQYLQTLDTQVILLVHDAEVGEDIYKDLKAVIGRFYDIQLENGRAVAYITQRNNISQGVSV